MTPPPVPPSSETVPADRGQRLLMIGLIIAGILLILFFGMRVMRSYMRMRLVHPGEGPADIEMVRGWMTVEYISRVYQVPEEVLFAAMNIPPQGNANHSLVELSRTYFLNQPGVLVNLVKTAIRIYQTEQSLPGLPAGGTPPAPPPRPDTPAVPGP